MLGYISAKETMIISINLRKRCNTAIGEGLWHSADAIEPWVYRKLKK